MRPRIAIAIAIITLAFRLTPVPTAAPARVAAQVAGLTFVDQVGGIGKGLAVEGGRAYLGVGPRLVVLDVSNPAQPAELGRSEALPDLVYGVAVRPPYAYVAAGVGGGLQVLDIRDPADIRVAGALDTPAAARDVVVRDGRAYLADDVVTKAGLPASLRVVDVSNPAHPREIASFAAANAARRVTLAGSYALLVDMFISRNIGFLSSVSMRGDGNRPLVVVDTNAGHPRLVTDASLLPETVTAAVGVGGRLFAFGSVKVGTDQWKTGLWITDVTPPAPPRVLGELTDVEPCLLRTKPVIALAATENRAYLLGQDSLFHDVLCVVDLADPRKPRAVHAESLPYRADTIVADGHLVYLAGGTAGLQVLDFTNPTHPVPIGAYAPPGHVYDVASFGPRAYVASHIAGVETFGVYTLAEGGGARVVAQSPIADCPWPACVGGLAAGPTHVAAVISGPLSNYSALARFGARDARPLPLQIPHTSKALLSRFADVVTVGGYAFVARRTPLGVSIPKVGFETVDLADPLRPRPGGTVDDIWCSPALPDRNTHLRLDVEAGRAYLAAGDCGVVIFDVARPEQPQLLRPGYGTVDSELASLKPQDIVVVGRRAYIVGLDFLAVLDVGDPGDLRLLGVTTLDLRQLGSGAPDRDIYDSELDDLNGRVLQVDGDLAIVGAGTSGVWLVDVADPARPRLVASRRVPGFVSGVARIGDTLLVAAGDGGLVTLRIEAAGR